MMELSEVLLPILREHFAWQGLREPSGNPFARFSAADPIVGDMELHDDGNEITITIGELHATHFGCYDPALSPEEQTTSIVNAVLQFLGDVLADKIEFPVALPAPRRNRKRKGRSPGLVVGAIPYVWSGPASRDGA